MGFTKHYCGICVYFVPETNKAGEITGATICIKWKQLHSFWQVIDNCSNFLDKVAAPDMYEALTQIAKGEGRFSRDPLTHASNTIEDMKALAVEALPKVTGE